MENYIAIVYDIKQIEKPVLLLEIPILAESRSEAIDKAHTEAESKFPQNKRMVSVKRV